MSIEFNNKFNNDIAAQKNQDGTTGAGAKNDTDKTLFTRQQFTNSIMNALSGTKLNDSQVSQFKQEATSIFSTYDNSPQDNKWSQTEANNGGTNALSTFFGKVNNAIKQATSTTGVNGTQDISSTQQTAETQSTPTNEKLDIEQFKQLQQKTSMLAQQVSFERPAFVNKFMNASPQEQKAIIQQEINDLKASGYDVVSMSNDGTMTIKNPDGSTDTLNIYDAMGLSAEQIQQIDKTDNNQQREAKTLQEVDNLQNPKSTNTSKATSNLSNTLDKYAQKGFQPVGELEQKTINGQTVLIGTLRNSNGEEVKINLKTGEEIKE